ncbi:MAG: LamG-like jellyroll fold domain-containing protein [Bacteroidales bacterium]
MRILFKLLLVCSVFARSVVATASDSVYYELWEFSNLQEIGGHGVSTFGDPVVVSTGLGDAVEFDGVDDQLIVHFNPLMDTKEFTVELIFWPAASYPAHTEPRFVHIQDPDDPDAKRVMMELRINEQNQCYLDGFMKTDMENLTLIDETLVHPTEVWHHAAITYKDSTFTTYFNGVKELSGTCRFSEQLVNPEGLTSLGARMNQVAQFSGKIRTLKVTHACLDPTQFLSIQDTAATGPDKHPEKGRPLQLFPNPADRMVYLQPAPEGTFTGGIVRLQDLGGSVVLEQEFKYGSGTPCSLDTSTLPPGVYMISFHSAGHTEYRKLMILH